MPNQEEWVGDQMYIRISNGDLPAPVVVHARFKKVKITGGVEPVEVTRGPNVIHKSFLPGTSEYPIELTLGINITDILPPELTIRKVYQFDIAINGNVEGEPLMTGEYFYEEIPIEIETGKVERVYDLKLKQYSIINDYFAGAKVPAGGIV